MFLCQVQIVSTLFKLLTVLLDYLIFPWKLAPFLLFGNLEKWQRYTRKVIAGMLTIIKDQLLGVMNGPLKFLTACKILPLLDLLAKFKRVLACSCSPNFCVARKLAKQIFYFCSCSQKNRSARHACECSQRPLVTPITVLPTISKILEKPVVSLHLSNLGSDRSYQLEQP